MTTPAPTDPDGSATDTGDEPAGRRLTPTRMLLTLVVVALVSMWGYVLYLAFGPGRQPPIDRLDDPAFAEAAEARCADALETVDALPVASEATSAADRADVLDQADAAFAAMLDDLEGMTELAPAAGDQRRRATEWLADWRTYLADREDYADRLRTDPGARLLVSEKPGEGRQITGWIDEFAKANRMPSCVSPADA
ncbi:MAG TPA: hypothetical protein VFI47_17530 [Acidimicrobiales bacterium]|nr:hypothetical protein [Acidimicrobiales bacterium]